VVAEGGGCPLRILRSAARIHFSPGTLMEKKKKKKERKEEES
jgi:hypothetical protein